MTSSTSLSGACLVGPVGSYSFPSSEKSSAVQPCRQADSRDPDRNMLILAALIHEGDRTGHGTLIRAAERWRSVKVTEFERRQMAAVRKELDQEYEATTSLGSQPTKGPTAVKISSTSRT